METGGGGGGVKLLRRKLEMDKNSLNLKNVILFVSTADTNITEYNIAG